MINVDEIIELESNDASEGSCPNSDFSDYSYLGVASTSPDSPEGYEHSICTWASETEFGDGQTQSSSSQTSEGKPDGDIVDFKVQDKIPTEIDKPIPHPRLMVKTVESRAPGLTVSKKLEGKHWLNNFTPSITDPRILIHLREELQNGPKGYFFCLSFIQKVLFEQRRVNRTLGLKLHDDKVFLMELGEKIKKCKAKVIEASKIGERVGEPLVHTQADEKHEIRLKEQRVTVESGKNANFDGQPVPTNEVSSPLLFAEKQKCLKRTNI